MEQFDKVFKWNYLAESLSALGNMAGIKHSIPKKEESSFYRKNSYPRWDCNYNIDFFLSYFKEKFYCLKILWHLLKKIFYKLG